MVKKERRGAKLSAGNPGRGVDGWRIIVHKPASGELLSLAEVSLVYVARLSRLWDHHQSIDSLSTAQMLRCTYRST